MLRLDHLVILVDDLPAAVADYRMAGFRVLDGGRHAGGLTENALVGFEDGTYLELIAFVDPGDTRDNNWGWRQFARRGGGLFDYCLASDDLDADVARLRAAGLTVGDPTDGGRKRPDGIELRWRGAQIWQPGRELPFLIEDLTPRELRVPNAPDTTQPNGIGGIRELVVAVSDVERIAGEVAALLETEPPATRPDRKRDGLAADFVAGSQRLSFVEPRMETGAVQLQIERAGVGPFEVLLQRRGGPLALDERLLHGASLRVEPA
jgi:catechol 2,3-dioxygenase-like lactoylglutathione lyase family enzyme